MKVTAKYTWRYYLASGSGTYTDYVTCNSTSPTQNGNSDVTKTATFTGKKFTPNYVKAWLQQKGSSGDYANIETFTIYVAQADAVSAMVGGGNKTIATPTISTAANWACQSANTGVATATVSGSGTSRTVTITPVAAGTTTIDVRSGSSTYSTGNPLRQRITVTVTGDTPAPTPTIPTTTNMVDVVEGETVALVTSKNVYSGQRCTFSIDSGSTSYVNIGQSQGGSFGTANITKAASSTTKQTIYAKGIAFSPNRAIVRTTGYRYDSTVSHTNIDVFVVNVAQADAVSATVGGGNKTISTPTLSLAASWACQSANTGVATATVSGSGTSRTVTITPVAAGTTTIDVRSGSSTYSTGNPLRQRITVTVTGGTPTPSQAKETWTPTFQMPMCADYYAGSGTDGAETHTFTKLTTKPSGNWKLTSEGSAPKYIGISANAAAAKPTLMLWPTEPGYVYGTIVDPGNASNFAEFGITLTYRKEETVPLATSGRTSVQKFCYYSGVYKDATDGAWSVTSTDASVASVSGVSGRGAEIQPVITALKAGTTTVTVGNAYATYVYNVVVSDPVDRPVDIVFTNEVRIAQRSTQTLTNDMGTAIAWDGAVCRSADENVVKVIQADGYVAVSNTLYDGMSQVDVSVPGTNYHFIVRSLTIDLEKTVLSASVADPNDKSNATIRITSHVLHGVNTIQTNQILFLSSVCTSHHLKQATIVNALNVLKTKGNVDWYLYGKYKDEAGEANKSGTLTLNGPNITTADLGSSFNATSHSNLRAYLTQLDARLDYAHQNYAYVILSFDGTRLASYMTNDDPDRDRRVAEKLAWYYENNRVIWIIDSSIPTGIPYGDEYYRPNSAVSSGGWGVDREAWEALVAMLDPATYLANPTGSRYTATMQDAGVDVWAATRNSLQVFYDNSDDVTAYLDRYVHEANYDVSLSDMILGLNGALSIATDTSGKKVRFYTWAGAGNPEAEVSPGQTIADLPNDSTHWKLGPASSCTVNGDEVKSVISNIVVETWNKYEIDVVDNGTFVNACLNHDPPLAVRDPETGRFIVNPNDGPARATVTVNETQGQGSSSTVTVQATTTAETTIPWEVEPDYPVEIWAQAVSLWITDHADAGEGKVHLAFLPSFDKPVDMAIWIPYARANNLVRYVMADAEAGLAGAPLQEIVSFRDGTGTQDVQKGWCWITVPSTETDKLYKIVINNDKQHK